MSTCEGLAADIVSTEPVTRSEIRRIMDAGWGATLTEGMTIEKRASRAHDKSQRPSDQVASRREQIQDRGRHQSGE
jgi:hypothetical protein